MTESKIYLKSKKDRSLVRQHPWVFSGAIKAMEGHPQDGDIVSVHANKGRFLGRGLFSTQGSISVRVLTFQDEPIEESFFEERIRSAFRLRKNLGLTDNAETEIYRLLHAEGDGIPGCIVDVYGQTAVFQAHDIGVHQMREKLAASILEASEGRITAVYDKSNETLPRDYRTSVENGYISGSDDGLREFKEYGHRFKIDWVTGQKTGFFIDQRENRAYLGSIAKDKKVLNTFCYTGGFSIYALDAGASMVHSLDSSQKAMDLVDENVALNGHSDKNHESIKADAVDYLKHLETDYDIIILDPPAFAKSMHSRHNAIQGYKRLNGHAIRQIKPGGVIMTFSCSQVITPQIFRDTVLSAAINENRKVRIIAQLHQPGDHPVNIFHPEGEYLKGLVLEVE
ncbi:MAG: class I SAM-dependent rRNA methyltransferase [Flavobacteriales bacterium]|nr:class I SAM-dependent rRNA methyltransferase [Flavobacteriales bacterium]